MSVINTLVTIRGPHDDMECPMLDDVYQFVLVKKFGDCKIKAQYNAKNAQSETDS